MKKLFHLLLVALTIHGVGISAGSLWYSKYYGSYGDETISYDAVNEVTYVSGTSSPSRFLTKLPFFLNNQTSTPPVDDFTLSIDIRPDSMTGYLIKYRRNRIEWCMTFESGTGLVFAGRALMNPAKDNSILIPVFSEFDFVDMKLHVPGQDSPLSLPRYQTDIAEGILSETWVIFDIYSNPDPEQESSHGIEISAVAKFYGLFYQTMLQLEISKQGSQLVATAYSTKNVTLIDSFEHKTILYPKNATDKNPQAIFLISFRASTSGLHTDWWTRITSMSGLDVADMTVSQETGNILICGQARSYVKFYDNTDTMKLQYQNISRYAGFVAMYTSSGTFLWHTIIDGLAMDSADSVTFLGLNDKFAVSIGTEPVGEVDVGPSVIDADGKIVAKLSGVNSQFRSSAVLTFHGNGTLQEYITFESGHVYRLMMDNEDLIVGGSMSWAFRRVFDESLNVIETIYGAKETGFFISRFSHNLIPLNQSIVVETQGYSILSDIAVSAHNLQFLVQFTQRADIYNYAGKKLLTLSEYLPDVPIMDDTTVLTGAFVALAKYSDGTAETEEPSRDFRSNDHDGVKNDLGNLSNNIIPVTLAAVSVVIFMVILTAIAIQRRHTSRNLIQYKGFESDLQITVQKSNYTNDDTNPFDQTLSDNAPTNFTSNPRSEVSVTALPHSRSNKTLFTQSGNVGISIPGFLEYDSNVDIRKDKLIATGGSGRIFRGLPLNEKLCQNGDVIIIKEMDLPNQTMIDAFFQEISIMYMLRSHQNIAKLLGYTENPYNIIMPYYPLGNLQKWIQRRQNIKNKSIIMRLTYQLADGLEYMTRIGISHCDLKTSNILIAVDHRQNIVPLISDFGISCLNNDTILTVKNFRVTQMKGASLAFASPETIVRYLESTGHKMEYAYRYHPKSSDIYSLGLIMFEVLTRRTVK